MDNEVEGRWLREEEAEERGYGDKAVHGWLVLSVRVQKIFACIFVTKIPAYVRPQNRIVLRTR